MPAHSSRHRQRSIASLPPLAAPGCSRCLTADYGSNLPGSIASLLCSRCDRSRFWLRPDAVPRRGTCRRDQLEQALQKPCQFCFPVNFQLVANKQGQQAIINALPMHQHSAQAWCARTKYAQARRGFRRAGSECYTCRPVSPLDPQVTGICCTNW